ncbi:MAG: hypothetical protein AAF065_04080 [Verrucomicrobiota bacterium]
MNTPEPIDEATVEELKKRFAGKNYKLAPEKRAELHRALDHQPRPLLKLIGSITVGSLILFVALVPFFTQKDAEPTTIVTRKPVPDPVVEVAPTTNLHLDWDFDEKFKNRSDAVRSRIRQLSQSNSRSPAPSFEIETKKIREQIAAIRRNLS